MPSCTSTRSYYEATADNFRSPNSMFWRDEAKQLMTISALIFENILEIGCGVGAEAHYFSRFINYFGIDITRSFLVQTRQNTGLQKLVQSNVESLPFANDSFESFWSAATLLHIPKSKIAAVLLEIFRCLKPGAYGFISLKEGDTEGLVVLQGEEHLPPRFFAFWRQSEFEKMLNGCGFKVLRVSKKSVNERHDPTRKVTWLCYFIQKPFS